MAGLTSDVDLATTYLAVPWQESNAQAWEIGADEHSATRFAQFDGSLEARFTAAICGYSELLADKTIARHIPEFHPKFEHLWARRVRFNRETGEPSNGGPLFSLVYERAEASVDYEPLPYLVWDDSNRPAGLARADEMWRYVSRTETFAVESVLVPGGSFQYEGGTVDVPEVPARVVPSFTAFVVWHEVPCEYDFDNAYGLPAIPAGIKTRIAAVEGHINSGNFLGYPPKTLLAISAEPTYRRMHDGKVCVDIKYTLAGRGTRDNTGVAAGVGSTSPDWERLLRKDGLFYRILNKVSGKGPYDDPVDFNDLLRSGA
jgi:hypothetical protein